MRRYAQSKTRLVLFLLMICLLVYRAPLAMGQSSASPDTGDSAEAPGIMKLVMSNRDPVFYTIMILSVVGTTLIIQGFIKNRRSVFMPRDTTELIRQMIAEKRFKDLIDFTENDPSFVSQSLNPALKRAPSFNAMKEAMETSIGEQTAEQFRRIEYLNIIGNLGPLLGLLGTVLGMIHAFQAMNIKHGQANPADLADGISKALCHTMLGLMLAVPCLAAFGVLRTIVDRLTVRGALEAEELLLMIKPVEARPAIMGRPGLMPPPALPQPGAVRKAPLPTPQIGL